MTLDHALSALAARLGPAPRDGSGALLEAFQLPPPPEWLGEGDDLDALRRHHGELVVRGELGLASIFMANSALWDEGDSDAPAGIVYSFDPVLFRFPDSLVRCGAQLYRYHGYDGEPPVDPWRRQLLDQLHSGFERPMHQRVPPELCQGHAVYHSSLVVFRDHLPGRRITGGLVPVLVARHVDGPVPAMIVPSALWPDALLQAWTPEDP